MFVLWFQALKRLFGVQNYYFGRNIVQNKLKIGHVSQWFQPTLSWPFFFQNNVFKLKEDFLELGIGNGLQSFQIFLVLLIWDEPKVLKRFQKQFWKPKKPRYTPVFRKYFVVSFLWSLFEANRLLPTTVLVKTEDPWIF
jgi:hypothetical protein